MGPDKLAQPNTEAKTPAPTKEEILAKLQAENAALRRMNQAEKAKKPKPWYKKWCRIGGLIAVLGPMVNYVCGNPVDKWIIMLVVGAIIAWIGSENYKDQKIAVATVLAQTQIDIEKIKLAPSFQRLLEKAKGGMSGTGPTGPPKHAPTAPVRR